MFLAGLFAIVSVPNFMKMREGFFSQGFQPCDRFSERKRQPSETLLLLHITSEWMFDLGKRLFPLVLLIQVFAGLW